MGKAVALAAFAVFLLVCSLHGTQARFDVRKGVYLSLPQNQEFTYTTYKSRREKMSLDECTSYCRLAYECRAFSWSHRRGCVWWRTGDWKFAVRDNSWTSAIFVDSRDSLCFAPAVLTQEPPCYDVSTMYTYEEHARKCVPFAYRGCLGGKNLFKTRMECQKWCS